jgi:hypothetical protein
MDKIDSPGARFCPFRFYPRPALRGDNQDDYEAFCAHYGMTPTRNNPGFAHERRHRCRLSM